MIACAVAGDIDDEERHNLRVSASINFGAPRTAHITVPLLAHVRAATLVHHRTAAHASRVPEPRARPRRATAIFSHIPPSHASPRGRRNARTGERLVRSSIEERVGTVRGDKRDEPVEGGDGRGCGRRGRRRGPRGLGGASRRHIRAVQVLFTLSAGVRQAGPCAPRSGQWERGLERLERRAESARLEGADNGQAELTRSTWCTCDASASALGARHECFRDAGRLP